MAFTSWEDLKDTIKDAIKDGSILTKSYSIEGRSHTFRDMGEVLKLLEYIDTQIAAEQSDAKGIIGLARFGRF